jgi:hypothetical protein
MESRRFLKTDNCSLNRERFDYARVLIATSSLYVIDMSAKIIVDWSEVDIKDIEEYGFNIGDDVCLYDEDEKSDSSSQRNEVGDEVFDIDNNVGNLTDKIVNDIVQADDVICKNVDGSNVADMETTSSNVRLESPISVQKMAALYEQQLERESLDGSVVPTLNDKLKSGKGHLETVDGGMQHSEADYSKVDGDVIPPKGRNHLPRSYTKEQRSLNSGPWSVD